MMSRADRWVLTVALFLWCVGVIGSLLASARHAALVAQIEGGSLPAVEQVRTVSPDDSAGPGFDEAAYATLPESAPAR